MKLYIHRHDETKKKSECKLSVESIYFHAEKKGKEAHKEHNADLLLQIHSTELQHYRKT